MKIVSLIENTPSAPQFLAEHGLSLYIETKQHKILFDAGATDGFAHNAALLGVDLSLIDTAVLSHGHSDHGGGLSHFLEINDTASIYVSPYAFRQYYRGEKDYIGLDLALKQNRRLIFTTGTAQLDQGIILDNCNDEECKYPIDSAGLTEKQGHTFIPDLFLHEQYLLLEENNRKILISGCSHKGILNLMHWFRPDVLIGGFHFMKQEITADGNPLLDLAAQELMKYNTVFYTCHCTGLPQYSYLKERMGEKLHYLSSGQTIEV